MKYQKKLSIIFQAVLIAFALQMRPMPALNREDFKSALHYLYAQITNLLGEYSVTGIFLFVTAAGFILWMRREGCEKIYSGRLLPVFFACCFLIGQNYAAGGSLESSLGDIFQIICFLLLLAGYGILFYYLIALFLGIYRKAVDSKWRAEWAARFFGENCFRNVFIFLMILWAPILILSYPGNLCYDCLGQIEQSMGISPYSTHHPLLHTLIVGGCVRLGKLLTGSCDPGLFIYILLQAAVLSAALAGTISRLVRRGAPFVIRVAVTGVYVFAPVYSNIVSTAVKDVPFMAAFIWYLLLLEELTVEGIKGRKPLYLLRLILVQALVALLRNNGIYVVVLTGIAVSCIWGKRKSVKKTLALLLCMAVFPFLIYAAGNRFLMHTLSAEKGSVAEMLSIPFQQTGRYLKYYPGELTEKEREAVESVLLNVDWVAERYNPDSADPVKALYQKDADPDDVAVYLQVWAHGFFRRPAVYIDAFLNHIYGWFAPGVSNAIRYEAESDLFPRRGLFSGADKILLFMYRFAEYIPPLAFLENAGVYTWLLFILAGVAFRERRKRGVLLIPLFVSLLVCMAAPCFYLHPRYAFPIMFTIPFLYGIMCGRDKPDDRMEQADLEQC